jgi:hypothetical protein
LPRPVWTLILLFSASRCNWDDRCMPPCPAFFCRDGVSETFWPRLAWNCDPTDLGLPCSLRWQAWVPSYQLRCGFMIYVPGLTSNHNPPDLSLPSRWIYTHEPRVPGFYWQNFKTWVMSSEFSTT